MAENIRKVFPPQKGTTIGSWYNDTDQQRYNRIINVLARYKSGVYDEHDVRWFIKCAIINNIYLSEKVHRMGDSAWKNPNNKRLQQILNEINIYGYASHKCIDIEKFRNNLRFEHIVPYKVVEKILVDLYNKGELDFKNFTHIRSKCNVCLVTECEDKQLNNYRQTMPDGTDWVNIPGDEFARYDKTNIKIYKRTIMKRKDKVKNNVIYFDTDEEFTDFCLAPYAIVKQTDNGILYYTGEYSDEYLRCIDEEKSFIIRDEDSVVYKRQCVCKRLPVIYNGVSTGRDVLVQLKVDNLEPYFGYY